RAHPRGAVWATRPCLDALLTDSGQARRPLLLIADEVEVARAAAIDLAAAGVRSISVFAGGFAAWQAAGLPIESTPDSPPDERCIDYLFFVHDRHDGNREAALQYLAWETQLIGQLDADERADFRIQA
ncbi:MAG: sulfurtransferase, partial [Proteobacteria bacterium]|nr:sulfurtransferase [Burkholderiales bacterium]